MRWTGLLEVGIVVALLATLARIATAQEGDLTSYTELIVQVGPLKVHASPNQLASVVTTLTNGEVIDLLGQPIVGQDGQAWQAARRPDGSGGGWVRVSDLQVAITPGNLNVSLPTALP